MALTGTTYRESFEYISERDPAKTKEDGATVFTLGNLPADLRSSIKDSVLGLTEGNLRMNTMASNLEAVRYGLKGVHNYVDEEGNQIKFKTEQMPVHRYGGEFVRVHEDFLNTMPDWLISELAQRILSANAVSKEERKNSSTQS